MKIKTKDKIEIAQLVARYFLAIDTSNLADYLATWLENGSLTADEGMAQGHAELKKSFIALQQGSSARKRHIVTNLIIEGKEDKVQVTSYLLVLERENKPQVVTTGIYHDEVVKVEGKWYFEKRHLQVDANGQTALALELA